VRTTLTQVELSEIARNYALLGVAVVGVIIAVWRAVAADRHSRAQKAQAAQARREHVSELFWDAVERLDNDKLHMRLGAIFALREIVEDYPDLARPTVDLLSAYLADMTYDSEPPRDVQEIIAVIVPRSSK